MQRHMLRSTSNWMRATVRRLPDGGVVSVLA
jgi:hypothetical protein